MTKRFTLFILLLTSQVVFSQKFQDTIPFRNDLGLIIIPVTFNGEEKQFAFDTGAEYSVAYGWAKEELKSTNKSINVRSSSGLRSKMRFYRSGNIAIGSRKISGHRILNTPKNDIFSCHNVDGILGVDIIKEFNWHIDFKQNKLIMYPSNYLPEADNSMHELNFVFANNHPYVYLKLKENRFRFLLDTGAGKSSNISQRDYNLTNIDEFPQLELHSGNFDVNGIFKTTRARVFRFPESTSNSVTLSPVIYYNNQKSSKIGNRLWRDVSLFLSLKKNKLYTSSSQITQDHEYYPCYVSYYDGTMRVMSIAKGSEIWDLGVRQGDTILRYNERQFDDFCALDQYQRKQVKLDKPITIRLQSGETVTLSKLKAFVNEP